MSESTCAFVGRRWKEIRVSVGLSDARISGGRRRVSWSRGVASDDRNTMEGMKVGVAREGPHNGLL